MLQARAHSGAPCAAVLQRRKKSPPASPCSSGARRRPSPPARWQLSAALITALTANGELQDDRSLVGRSQGVLVEQHGARRCLLGAHGLVHGGHAEDELRRDEEAL